MKGIKLTKIYIGSKNERENRVNRMVYNKINDKEKQGQKLQFVYGEREH